MSGESSRTTHGATACIDACRYLGALIAGAVQGASKAALLSPRYAPVAGLWERRPLCPEIDDIARGSFQQKSPPAIVGSGYVVKSLEAALWAFAQSSTFREGCLLAVNLGHDADTTGAIYGQLAGVYYGIDGILPEWLEPIAHADLIRELADKLFELEKTLYNLVLDSGAAEVVIPADVVLTLLRTGTVAEEDFLPGKSYTLADGSSLRSLRF